MFFYSSMRHDRKGEAFHLQRWPNSLASKYMRATREQQDYAVMTR